MASLHVPEIALQVATEPAPFTPRIAKKDRNFAQQLRRAATSIVLDIGEGEHSDSGTRRARFHSAAGSASETRSALRLATARRHLQREQAEFSLGRLGPRAGHALEAHP
jgi:four helix bundle protein